MNDILLVSLLLLLPLVTAATIHLLLAKRKGSALSLAMLSSSALLLLAGYLFFQKNHIVKIDWLSVGNFQINIQLVIDNLSKGMFFIVALVGFLVHVFSLVYMHTDKAVARYFGNLSLFLFAMIGIVFADNFLLCFIFWEFVGLSSYLLISHWFQKETASNAAKKAFLCNRFADFAFLTGIMLLTTILGTESFSNMAAMPTNLILLNNPYLFGTIILLIFAGVVGKSAQFPLHVWLPDAMEGPTPASALMHAATMVAAGVYMFARFCFSLNLDALYQAGQEMLWQMPVFAFNIIAYIGATTAVIAALFAIAQQDIKKILAYSTLSQLGYMVMALGVLQPGAALFHLFTHAWFKALLFLCAGSLIFALHHKQNIWQMGGLWKKMPVTTITFLIGMLALMAVPFSSGFYSKEGILYALDKANSPLVWVGIAVGGLTAFYMTRVFVIVFLGEPKTKEAKYSEENGFLIALPLITLALMTIASPFISIANKSIIPLVKKAVVGLPLLKAENTQGTVSVEWMPHFTDKLFLCTLCALIIGSGLAFVLYVSEKKERFANRKWFNFLQNGFYIDLIYQKVVIRIQDIIALVCHIIDTFVIGVLLVEGLVRCVFQSSSFCQRFWLGKSPARAVIFAVILLVISIYFILFFN